MKCGKCKTEMIVKKSRFMGETVEVYECQTCGKTLMNLNDAAKIQKNLIPEIADERNIISVGTSMGVTLPAKLKNIYHKGDKIKIRFDPMTMETIISRA